VAPRNVTQDQLPGGAAALGCGRRLEAVQRLLGGTTKGVYRLTMDDAMTVIAYLWKYSWNCWPITDHADPFFPGIGLGLFEGARGGTRGWGR
jgi:hypothetical protein